MRAMLRNRQNGVTLIVVLIFIAILTTLGVFAARRALFGEGLARNQLDETIAREAAEAALRDAERDIMLDTGTQIAGAVCARGSDRPIKSAYGQPNFDTNCPRGQCRVDSTAYYQSSNATSATNPAPWWPGTSSMWNNTFSSKPPQSSNCQFTGGVPIGTFTGTPLIEGVAHQPEYLIEYMQRGLDVYYRITARGFGLDENTQVVVQTYFQRGTI